MLNIKSPSAQRVFYYFEQLSAIPHGSGNMNAIAQFCVNFAKEKNLKCIRDEANNVVIYKNGTVGCETNEPIILQGHLDMVCQKTDDRDIDFEKDGLDLYIDGDFIKARGTTLGADNGIAVAIVLAILESNDIAHPPIEAVFTTDEEVGMIGARAMDMSVLGGRRMINLDSETDGLVTVSCAGGSDFVANIPLITTKKRGYKATLTISGLQGGHSGVEINKGRVNADILAGRILNHLNNKIDFDIISVNGGNKANAIPNRFFAELCVYDDVVFCELAKEYASIIKLELCDREKDIAIEITTDVEGEYSVLDLDIKNKVIYTLLCVPNGVCEMSSNIENLVQTSLNLGILQTTDNNVSFHFALRSNKQSALVFLEDKLATFFKTMNAHFETYGHYPPWEYRDTSVLRDLYCDTYYEMFTKHAHVKAIHAGLECGVFAGQIDNLDCISIGPQMHDVHTTRERLSISSTEKFYDILIKILGKLK